MSKDNDEEIFIDGSHITDNKLYDDFTEGYGLGQIRDYLTYEELEEYTKYATEIRKREGW